MKAVYWSPKGKDRYGEDTYYKPEEIKCRWENALVKDIGPNMEETVYKSTVYVDRKVLQGGKLWLGKLADLVGGSAEPPDDASEIRTVEEFPTMRANQVLRIARL
jgi:hypothetical protein